jgi:hypothetical protein
LKDITKEMRFIFDVTSNDALREKTQSDAADKLKLPSVSNLLETFL